MDFHRFVLEPTEPTDQGLLYRLYFVGDLHFGTTEFNHRAWQKFVIEYVEHPGYVIFMGDLAEFISLSDPRFDITLLDKREFKKFTDVKEYAFTILRLLEEKLEIFKNYTLLFLGGNHEAAFFDATTISPLRYLSESFGVPYSHYRAYVAMSLRDPTADCYRSVVTAILHHGAGQGRRRGSSINRVEEMTMWGSAELYVMGHSHQLIASPGKHYRYQAGKLKLRPVWYIRGGTFRTGDDNSQPEPIDYSVKRGYQPLPAGCPRVNIYIPNKRKADFEITVDLLSWV